MSCTAALPVPSVQYVNEFCAMDVAARPPRREKGGNRKEPEIQPGTPFEPSSEPNVSKTTLSAVVFVVPNKLFHLRARLFESSSIFSNVC